MLPYFFCSASVFSFCRRNFERGVLAGYRWLSNHYQPGDRIFLFGFSRGAYQIRTLAAMIGKVGLILPGNEEQIPFAYELYADLKTHSNKGYDGEKSAQFFKDTFSRTDVRIHFLGAWDAVSSVGIVRGKNLPGTDSFNDNICYFRHALALDERRVKFLPEYICGGASYAEQLDSDHSHDPRVKEVWFAGCHSDIGGGLRINDKLDNAAVPVLWMGNEAQHAGLKIKASRVEWKWEELETSKPTESLTWVWRVIELLPIRRLAYVDNTSVIWRPHLSKGRVIKPGQKIHASVAFIKNYKPKAILPSKTTGWKDILEKGSRLEHSWTTKLRDILEMDLFDLSNIKALIEDAKFDHISFDRLRFLSSTREGAASIGNAEPALQLFTTTLNSTEREPVVRRHSAQILLNLAGYENVRRSLTWSEAISALAAAAAAEDLSFPQLKTHLVFEVLSLLCRDGTKHFDFEHPEDLQGLIAHLNEIIDQSREDDVKKSLEMFVFGEFNYILYLRDRIGIEDDVSTFEHYFRRSLGAASPQSPPGLNASSNPHLEKSVELYRAALTASETAPGSFGLECLGKLATCLQVRFFEIGLGHTDLDEAIARFRDGLAACDVQKSNARATFLTNLADTLTARFTQSKDSQDIEDAIQLYRQALDYHLPSHPGRGIALNNLASALYEHSMMHGDFHDFDECIQLYRDGLLALPPSDPTRARSLTNLAGAIQKRFNGIDNTGVIKEVIQLQQEAAALCLPLDLGTCLDNLGNSVYQAQKSNQSLPLIREAISWFNHLLGLRNGSTSLLGVALEMHRLVGYYPGRVPDRTVGHDGNMVDRNRKCRFPKQAQAKYGFTIRNTSKEDLFPYLFFFDPDTYTISLWYSPAGMHAQPPLKSGGGTVTIGMGGEPAFEFALPKGVSSSSAFLKLFVSTHYLDLDWIQQRMSPLNPDFQGWGRLAIIRDRETFPPGPQWDTFNVSLTMTSE
ncbi:hypothetical protein FB451DRAFT_1232827 [Mycena latifolia]|nr:hypothetical protein FB451DRAFT_1232827 [Mycena latifolia]